jgi:hypothetical protein
MRALSYGFCLLLNVFKFSFSATTMAFFTLYQLAENWEPFSCFHILARDPPLITGADEEVKEKHFSLPSFVVAHQKLVLPDDD